MLIEFNKISNLPFSDKRLQTCLLRQKITNLPFSDNILPSVKENSADTFKDKLFNTCIFGFYILLIC